MTKRTPPGPSRPPRRRAAALRYDPARDVAPRLVARGDGRLADRILELARAHDIPVHEDRALVDVLARLEIGQSIPPEIYRVVAEIIAFLYRLQGQVPASITSGGPASPVSR